VTGSHLTPRACASAYSAHARSNRFESKSADSACTAPSGGRMFNLALLVERGRYCGRKGAPQTHFCHMTLMVRNSTLTKIIVKLIPL